MGAGAHTQPSPHSPHTKVKFMPTFTFANPLFVAGLAIAGAILIAAILAATQPPQQK